MEELKKVQEISARFKGGEVCARTCSGCGCEWVWVWMRVGVDASGEWMGVGVDGSGCERAERAI